KAKSKTRRAFYEEIYSQLNEGWEALQALNRVVDEKFGRQAPSLSELQKDLDAIRTLIEIIVQEKRKEEPDRVPVGAEAHESDSGANGIGIAGTASPAVAGLIRGRADALKRLADVAEYFEKTEPQSPVSYLVRRAIRWSHLSLEAWLAEMIKSPEVLY